MNTLLTYFSLFSYGAAISIGAWISASFISLFIGTLIGIISCNYLTTPLITALVKTYTFIAKGIPAYVQILIAYFVLPSLLGINLPGFIAATAALAFCSSGYITEIIRAGINSIDTGQWQACFALGYPLQKTLLRIILPQAFTNILPALFGELEQLLKSTSLLATIGVAEITRVGMNIISRELNPLPVYFTVAGIYLLLSGFLQLLNIYIERRLCNDNR